MGLAYLPDGTSMDYKEYIATHPHWQLVRRKRFEFDNGLCAVCHRGVHDGYETHHLYYTHLGNEHLTDVITLCPSCHTKFHNAWQKQDFWKGREQNHWQAFDLEHTAQICACCWKRDRFISGNHEDVNLCNKDIQREVVEEYLRTNGSGQPILIDPNDIGLFVRNKRYELWFHAEDEGLTMEQFLDRQYGEKVRGNNPMRVEAGRFFGKHKPESFRRNYKANKNINVLMKEVKKHEKA